MMKEDKMADGNVLDQMLKKYSHSEYYLSMFKKIIKEVKKNIDIGTTQYNETSTNDFYGS